MGRIIRDGLGQVYFSFGKAVQDLYLSWSEKNGDRDEEECVCHGDRWSVRV